MQRLKSSKLRLQAAVSLLVAGMAVCAISLSLARGADSKPGADPAPDKSAEKKAQKKLTGAELYAIHCNRCHPERYPTERTAAQWKTIMEHMRIRANLPADQAKTILKYLQEEATP